MISWIVASHIPWVLEDNLLRTLDLHSDEELIVIRDAPSITQAYAEGQEKSTLPLRCYIHHDVEILDPARLRAELVAHAKYGMVGLVGSREPVVPWWNGTTLGSVIDGRMGLLNFGAGGECSYLDGLLLATTHDVEWDPGFAGWHGYDHDACQQMLARGLPNWCLTAGHQMVRHNTSGPPYPDKIPGFHEAMEKVREKWT